MYLKKQTLQDDFGFGWNLPKYRNRDIEAKQYASNMITNGNVGKDGWPSA